MTKIERWGAMAGVGMWIAVAAAAQPQNPGWGGGEARRPASAGPAAASAPPPLLTGTVDPRLFGTQSDTITVVTGAQFRSSLCYFFDPVTLSDYCTCVGCTAADHTYSTLDIPAGAVIDYIGVNNATPVDASMGFTLHFRDHLGGSAELASFSFPAHEGGGFATDFAGPLGILIPGNHDRAFLLDIERAPADGATTYLGYVEIWWHRTVSDPPATPSFGDVPATDLGFQYIEALAASGVTGGCGGGNYCPDALLTRRQMAIFLAKALGLHWTN